MPLPILADFAIRLGGGLSATLAVTPWRVVPPAFFRTHCQVILGLGVLATLASARGPSGPLPFGLSLAMAVLAFLGTVAWGLGLPRVGVPIAVAIAAVAGLALVLPAAGASGPARLLEAAGSLASAFLLGATLTSMLLGHHYLTAPNMAIEPLKRFVRFMAAGLVVRAGLSATALALWSGGPGSATVSTLFLAMRWGMGFVGVGLATYLTWKTVAIRSTQSATGILYIATTLLLFGELSAASLAGESPLLS